MKDEVVLDLFLNKSGSGVQGQMPAKSATDFRVQISQIWPRSHYTRRSGSEYTSNSQTPEFQA